MKKLLFLTLVILLFNQSNAQINFEKGYIINSSNTKIECYIRNVDWKNNPTTFDYKLSENGEIIKGDIDLVNEFAILGFSKYVKRTVDIDHSSDLIGKLSTSNTPLFTSETVFLKVLIEGKADLFQYHENNLTRYFYQLDENEIEPLIYKRYFLNDKKIAKNDQFKRQILNDLKCASIKQWRIENLEYTQRPLSKLFADYNNCTNSMVGNFQNSSTGNFNINIRPRLNSTTVAGTNHTIFSEEFDFGNKLSISAGIELEYVLPFNKNKWSLTAEPNYSSYKREFSVNTNNVSGGILIADLEYKSINIPIGIRHYIFFNKNSKIFIDAAYNLDIDAGDSFLTLKRGDGSLFRELNLDGNNNFSFGLGYKLMDKYIVQVRYDTSKDILSGYDTWSSKYNNLSFIVGYTIF